MSAATMATTSAPAAVDDERWASCSHCRAIRPTSKYRPDGLLMCSHCGQSRRHEVEYPAIWAERSTWLVRLFRAAGIELVVGPLPPLARRPSAVAVACFEVDGAGGPLGGIRVTLNEDLTPWGVSRALREAWDCLPKIDYWRASEWTTGQELGWHLPGAPGDVDAAHRADHSVYWGPTVSGYAAASSVNEGGRIEA